MPIAELTFHSNVAVCSAFFWESQHSYSVLLVPRLSLRLLSSFLYSLFVPAVSMQMSVSRPPFAPSAVVRQRVQHASNGNSAIKTGSESSSDVSSSSRPQRGAAGIAQRRQRSSANLRQFSSLRRKKPKTELRVEGRSPAAPKKRRSRYREGRRLASFGCTQAS